MIFKVFSNLDDSVILWFCIHSFPHVVQQGTIYDRAVTLVIEVCHEEGIELWYVAGGFEGRGETGKGNLLNCRICNMELQPLSHILK